MRNTVVVLLLCLSALVLGLFLGTRAGRNCVSVETVRYEQQETQTGHYGAPELIPERTELPELAKLPVVPTVVWTGNRTDTVWLEPDTAEIVEDWLKMRHYSKLLFDDRNGKLVVSTGTQYNRLAYLDYEFTPVRETVVTRTERWCEPFVSLGYATNGSVCVGTGLFFRHVGLEYRYSRNFPIGDGYHTFALLYKL